MKFSYLVFGIIMLFMIFSCGKTDTAITPNVIYEFQAISLGVGGECQLCQIKFVANIDKVDSILGITAPVDSIYYALSLPAELNVPGTLMTIYIRKPLYIEVPNCNYKGKFFNSVYVEDAKKN